MLPETFLSTTIWRTFTLMLSPRDDFARMTVSWHDQSSLKIADGWVKLVVNEVGRGNAGRDLGRYTNGVETVLRHNKNIENVSVCAYIDQIYA